MEKKLDAEIKDQSDSEKDEKLIHVNHKEEEEKNSEIVNDKKTESILSPAKNEIGEQGTEIKDEKMIEKSELVNAEDKNEEVIFAEVTSDMISKSEKPNEIEIGKEDDKEVELDSEKIQTKTEEALENSKGLHTEVEIIENSLDNRKPDPILETKQNLDKEMEIDEKKIESNSEEKPELSYEEKPGSNEEMEIDKIKTEPNLEENPINDKEMEIDDKQMEIDDKQMEIDDKQMEIDEKKLESDPEQVSNNTKTQLEPDNSVQIPLENPDIPTNPQNPIPDTNPISLDKSDLQYMQLNSALGSVIGAFIGDALGSAIEFISSVTEEDLLKALSMNGGIFRNGPGQVTDDSELAMCILNGLNDSLPHFSTESIANYYKKWIMSGPFDVGATTSNAFYPLYNKTENLAKKAQLAAKHCNQQSLSNGSFMRSSPLAVYCRHFTPEEIKEVVTQDSSMTHSNPIIHETETMYIMCISHLIQNSKDKQGAIEKVFKFAEQCGNEAREWLDDAFNDEKTMPGTPSMGYVKIAFDHSFRELRRNEIDFKWAMANVLSIGGDTDTNAAIVGAMIGAYVGYDALPESWKIKVETFGPGVRGIPRPDFLNQRAVKGMVERIFYEAPKSLVTKD